MLAVDNRSDEKLQRAYEKNCVVRLHVLDIWESPTVADVPAQRAPPSGGPDDQAPDKASQANPTPATPATAAAPEASPNAKNAGAATTPLL